MYRRPGYDPVAVIKDTKRFPIRKSLPQVFDSKRGAFWNPEHTSGIVAVSGVRWGFNGQKPRLTDSSITSDCVVIRPDGSRFTIKRKSNGRNHKVNMNALIDAQNARDRRHSVNASSLAPIGDSNH